MKKLVGGAEDPIKKERFKTKDLVKYYGLHKSWNVLNRLNEKMRKDLWKKINDFQELIDNPRLNNITSLAELLQPPYSGRSLTDAFILSKNKKRNVYTDLVRLRNELVNNDNRNEEVLEELAEADFADPPRDINENINNKLLYGELWFTIVEDKINDKINQITQEMFGINNYGFEDLIERHLYDLMSEPPENNVRRTLDFSGGQKKKSRKKTRKKKKSRKKTRKKKKSRKKNIKGAGDFKKVGKDLLLKPLNIGSEVLSLGNEGVKVGTEAVKFGQQGIILGQEAAKVGQEAAKATGKITSSVGDVAANSLRVVGSVTDRLASNQERKIQEKKMKQEEGLEWDKKTASLEAEMRNMKMQQKLEDERRKIEKKNRKRIKKDMKKGYFPQNMMVPNTQAPTGGSKRKQSKKRKYLKKKKVSKKK